MHSCAFAAAHSCAFAATAALHSCAFALHSCAFGVEVIVAQSQRFFKGHFADFVGRHSCRAVYAHVGGEAVDLGVVEAADGVGNLVANVPIVVVVVIIAVVVVVVISVVVVIAVIGIIFVVTVFDIAPVDRDCDSIDCDSIIDVAVVVLYLICICKWGKCIGVVVIIVSCVVIGIDGLREFTRYDVVLVVVHIHSCDVVDSVIVVVGGVHYVVHCSPVAVFKEEPVMLFLRNCHGKDAANHDAWRGHFIEVSTRYLPPGAQGEESITTLGVTGWAEANASFSAVLVDRIRNITILVRLGIRTKRDLAVLGEVKLFTRHDSTGAICP